MYFYRADYDVKARTLTPPVAEWKKLCDCGYPQNPCMLYIQCDGCDNWYHPKCQKTTEQEVQAMPKWFCLKCINNR